VWPFKSAKKKSFKGVVLPFQRYRWRGKDGVRGGFVPLAEWIHPRNTSEKGGYEGWSGQEGTGRGYGRIEPSMQ